MKSFVLFIPEIRFFLSSGDWEGLKGLLLELHPMDIAEGFSELNINEQLTIFRLLPESMAVSVFEGLAFEDQKEIIKRLEHKEAISLLERMSSDERVDFFSLLSPEVAAKFLPLMKKEKVAEVVSLLKYDRSTAGGRMSTEFIALNEEFTVEEAYKRLHGAIDTKTVSYIYVVDQKNHLKGVVSLQSLIIAKPGTRLSEVMTKNVIKVKTSTDQEEVATIVAKYDLLAIPVVEEDDTLVGIVTVDDIMDVLEEEFNEDIYKMSGTVYEEDILEKSPLRRTYIRLPWLIPCLFGEMISGIIMKQFQITLNQVITLAFFIPLIMAMGGNVGTQSSAIIIRSMATGRINVGDTWKILYKEVLTGMFLGILCGITVAVVAPLFHIGTHGLGIIVGLSMIVALTIATFVGTLSPIVFKKCRIDPAVASGPFITTTVDITGIAIYLGIATLLLRVFYNNVTV